MLRIGSVVLGVQDVARSIEFWQLAIGYELREEPEDDRWAILISPSGIGSQLALMRSEIAPQPHPRVHLDLYASNQDLEIVRLVELGAKEVDWDSYPDSPGFVVLEDPDGNRFCVIEKDQDWFGFG
jgi:catechol 2,3-dioxygenase-like lactoylglutathione lyase family enzyme